MANNPPDLAARSDRRERSIEDMSAAGLRAAGPAGLWVIAVNTLAEIRHRRVVWLVVLVGLFVAGSSYSRLVFFEKARAAGEMKIAADVSIALATSILGAWAVAARLLAVCLGAGAIATERRAKTIVTILARPIERWEYLLGRWAGVQIFALGFFAIGLLSTLGLAVKVGAPLGIAFWLHAAEEVVNIVYMAGVSLALGSVLAPVIAGSATFFLPALAAAGRLCMGLSSLPLYVSGIVLYALAPASMPSGLIGTGGSEPIVPRYGLFAAVLAENLGYTAAALLIACWWFGRREVRIGE